MIRMPAERYNGLISRSVRNMKCVEANLAVVLSIMETLDRVRTANPAMFWSAAKSSRLTGATDDACNYEPAWQRGAAAGSAVFDHVASDGGRPHILTKLEREALHQRWRVLDADYHTFVMRYEKVR